VATTPLVFSVFIGGGLLYIRVAMMTITAPVTKYLSEVNTMEFVTDRFVTMNVL
jgi:hypothetical protein